MKTHTLATLAFVLLSFCSPMRAQWVRNDGPNGYIYSFAVSDTNLFAGTRSGDVLHSTNNGTSWTAKSVTNTDVRALATSGTNLFAGSWGVFRSTDNGTSWTAAGLTNSSAEALATSGTNLFAGTYDDGLFLSTNNGASWTAINTGLEGTCTCSPVLFVSDTNLFAGTWGDGVFLSTNNGTSWNAASTGLTSLYIHAFTISDTNLFAGTYFGSGVYRSTNNGAYWTAASTGLTNSNVRALAVSPNGAGPNGAAGANLFAGTDGSGVFLSTNNGTSWTAASTGLTNTVVNALVVSGMYLFAGTGDGVWRRPLSEMITSVPEIAGGELPRTFDLKQNYPNPFNPSTTIQFSLPRAAHVVLRVFNMLGEQITTLVSDERGPGTYTTRWDTAGVASGVYFYRLEAGSFSQSRKLLLLK